MDQTRLNRRKAGYTLAELLVVMVILGLLAAIATPIVLNQLGGARHQTAQTQVENFATALSYYRLNVGQFPDASQGLSALVSQPSGATRLGLFGYAKKTTGWPAPTSTMRW